MDGAAVDAGVVWWPKGTTALGGGLWAKGALTAFETNDAIGFEGNLNRPNVYPDRFQSFKLRIERRFQLVKPDRQTPRSPGTKFTFEGAVGGVPRTESSTDNFAVHRTTFYTYTGPDVADRQVAAVHVYFHNQIPTGSDTTTMVVNSPVLTK